MSATGARNPLVHVHSELYSDLLLQCSILLTLTALTPPSLTLICKRGGSDRVISFHRNLESSPSSGLSLFDCTAKNMDAFGDNFINEPEIDPAAEFLAREQDQLAGLEDEIPPVAMSTAAAAAPMEDDLAGAFGNMKTTGGGGGDSEGSFEMINTIGQPTESSNSVPESIPTITQVREEPEKIRKWREEQLARLEQKDAEEEKKKEEWREAAKKELEEWYKHHAETTSKTKATNRESAKNAEKQFVAEADEVEPGTEWERIAKLCDFNPKSSRTSKDVSRMRSIILQLKQTPPAPVNA